MGSLNEKYIKRVSEKSSENLNEIITLRLPSELKDKLNRQAHESGVSRSAIVIKALKMYFDSTYCISCGTYNPAGVDKCIKCQTQLFTEDDIKKGMELYAAKLAEEKKIILGDDNGYLHEYIPKIIPLSRREDDQFEYALHHTITLPTGEKLPCVESKVIIEKDELLNILKNNKSQQ